MLVVHAAVQRDIPQRTPVAEVELFAHVGGLGVCFARTHLHESVEEQVHVVVARIFWHGKSFYGVVAG